MNKMGVDLIGEIRLFKNSSKKQAIAKDYWGHASLEGEKRNDSYYIYLLDTKPLELGGVSKAEFKFKFSDDTRFNLKVKEGQKLELNEGSNQIGEFVIEKIVNKKLK